MKGHSIPEFVKQVFDGASDNGKTLSPEAFARFLENFQGRTGVSKADASRIISKFASSGDALDMGGFMKFLLDPELNAAVSITEKPRQDMTAPLSHYYIYTSHNSYLKGNQLTSQSCSSPIISALRNGCRVVELDCWEHKGKVMVFHGGTLTKAVPFDVCITAIKEHAFVASEYPVIVTIENHLAPALQQEAAKIIREVIGDALYIPPQDNPTREFLSPWDLRGKIIISDKPPKDRLSKQVVEDPEGAVEAVPHRKKDSSSSSSGCSGNEDSTSTDEDEGEDGIRNTSKRKLTRAAEAMAAAHLDHSREEEEHQEIPKIPELQQLLYIYCTKPSEMENAPVNGELVCGENAIMANMSEPQLKKSVKKSPTSLIQYTRNNLGRMYPFGLRFDSSNADPMLAWSHGFQLAALNLQGKDRPCWVARGFFMANGACGYIKKADFFLTDSPDAQPPSTIKLILKVRVLTGTDWHKRFDLFSKPDFYVKVAVHGIAADKLKKRTKVAHRTSHPNWESETFEFPLRVPELAVLRFEVWEHDRLARDDFVGQACMPVHEIQPGLRVVVLQSKRGQVRSSKLLCYFTTERQ